MQLKYIEYNPIDSGFAPFLTAVPPNTKEFDNAMKNIPAVQARLNEMLNKPIAKI